jgi:acyl-CoA synthetase (AMP-forming)/AMP-acid ligase II/cytochrome P450
MRADGAWEDLLAMQAGTYGDRLAYSWHEKGAVRACISYSDLLRTSDIVAGHLQSQFRPGDRIALIFGPGLDFIEAFFGCTRAGLIPVPLSPSLGRHQFAPILPILINCQAAAVLGPELLWKRQQSHAKSVDQRQDFIWLNWASVKAEAQELNALRRPASQGDIAFLQYTSGSTGNPRGVIVGHANVLHNLQQILDRCASKRPRKFLSWLPHFHDMGLIGGILHALYTGSESLLMAPSEFMRRPTLWLEMIHANRVDCSMGPESALNLVQRAAGPDLIETLDLSCLECLVCGSEPIRRTILDRFLKTLAPTGLRPNCILSAYGLAEATLMTTASRHLYNSSDSHLKVCAEADLASSGSSIDGQTIRIVDSKTMAQVPDGSEGLIMVKGPSVNRGYWNSPDANATGFDQAIFNEQGEEINGYLNTGDLGLLDEGQLYVTGRIKDLIIVGGRNVHPSDVEVVVHSLSPRFASSRCICFGMLTPEGNERMVILIESQSKYLGAEDETLLLSVATQISGSFEVQVACVYLLEPNTLPVTTSGKARRLDAKQQYCASGFNPMARWPQEPSQVINANIVLPLIKLELASLTGHDALLIEAGQTLKEFAIGSLQLAELKIALDQQLETDLPIGPFLDDLTLRQLAERLCELMAAEGHAKADGVFDDSPALRALMLAGLPDHLRQLQLEHGDWLSLRWGRQVIHLLSDPSEVQQLMHRPPSEFIRGKVFEGIRMVTDGNNLFTTEGQAWRSERQRAQPLLTRKAVESMVGDFATICQGCLLELKGDKKSSVLDLADLCRTITLKITLHKLFGPISAATAHRVALALSSECDWRLPLHYLAQSEFSEARAARANAGEGATTASIGGLLPELDALVYGSIDALLASSEPTPCLLAAYLADPEVQAMNPGERRHYLRSVMLSLVLAGLDSTGSGLFFCLDLLARQAESQRLVRDEVHTVFGDGEISPTDLPRQLPYTLAAVQEALRLYPPIWFLGREAVITTTVMGQPVAAGDIVLTSPYVIHRHPGHWNEPDQFRPERFLKQPAAGPGTHLFMPFGIGPRTCVGRWLALYEMSLCLAALVQQHQLFSDGDANPELSSYFTLRTLKPIKLRVEPLG